MCFNVCIIYELSSARYRCATFETKSSYCRVAIGKACRATRQSHSTWFETSRYCLACENIRFSSFFAAGDVSRGGNARNVPIDEERGETDVFAG